MKKYLLLAFVSSAWAVDVPDIVKQSEDIPIEQIVKDTFTPKEYADWQASREQWEKRTKEENDQQLACVAKGTNPKTCVDPHWCLYPDKLDTKECLWYRVKYKL